ncbi:MAG: 4'-phosphopantetheinyl transferase family protein [Flavisolibacter sp.]
MVDGFSTGCQYRLFHPFSDKGLYTMIHIYYHTGTLTESQFRYHLQSLPLSIQQKITSFKKKQDAERSLMGKVLLQKALSDHGRSTDLDAITYTEAGKPFIDPSAHFSISHSGDYTVCALGSSGRIGIDIEKIRAIPIRELKDYFTPSDWQQILGSNDSEKELIFMWTRKEALLKAIGAEYSLGFPSVASNQLAWKDSQWFFRTINLDDLYACHLCVENSLPDIVVEEYKFSLGVGG